MLQSALAAARQVLDDGSATQHEIDLATTALGTALVGLELAKAPAPKPVHVKKIKLNQSQLSLVKGKRFTLRAGIYYSNDHAAYRGKVTWKSSNTRIATVDSAGKITAKKPGRVTITATTAERNAAGKKLSASIKVKVVKKKPKAKVTRVHAAPPTRMSIGRAAYITGKYSSSRTTGVSVRYASSKPDVLSVDRAGRVLARKAGTAYVLVSAGGKTVRYRITVR
ncbi:MAG: Ig domain-containing protein [Actinobacteria bacterium]|nr:Ig domain-containing protein [Actinomycetota bacterium]